MAIFYVPGDTYLRSEEKRAKRKSGLFFLAVLLFVGLVIFFTASNLPDEVFFLCVFLTLPVIYFCFRNFRLVQIKSRNFRRGRMGEYRAVEELKNLSDDWHVFYDLVLPGERGNIDIAVFGPGGVFAIDVKSHQGRIEYANGRLLKNGQPLERDFLNQARHESRQLKNFFNHARFSLPMPVPVIVFPSRQAHLSVGSHAIEGVFICHISSLLKLIQDCSTTQGLTSHESSSAADILKQSFPGIKVISMGKQMN